MKYLLLLPMIVFLVSSCQKEMARPDRTDEFVGNVYRALKDSMADETFEQLDWMRMTRATLDDIDIRIVRIPFAGRTFLQKFVILKVTSSGSIERGYVLNYNLNKNSIDGTLTIESLNLKPEEQIQLVQGFRSEGNAVLRNPVMPAPVYTELPEVIVTASYPPSGGMDWHTWYSLLSVFNDNNLGWGVYGRNEPYGGGGGGSGSTGPSSNEVEVPYAIVDEDIIRVDFESQYANPAIDLEKYIKCLNDIPDAGATCRITLFTDVPVNDDPTKIMDWRTGSPGHAWIRIEKDGVGDESGYASQHIGFYPKSGWKLTLTDAPVDGKWVDNQHHEQNAYYTVTISPENLRGALTYMLYLKNFVKYDIDDYNCVDWAMAVFKEAAGYGPWFEIPKFQMPGSLSPNGSSTPQGLYIKFKELKDAGNPGFVVPLIGWAGASTGPCN